MTNSSALHVLVVQLSHSPLNTAAAPSPPPLLECDQVVNNRSTAQTGAFIHTSFDIYPLLLYPLFSHGGRIATLQFAVPELASTPCHPPVNLVFRTLIWSSIKTHLSTGSYVLLCRRTSPPDAVFALQNHCCPRRQKRGCKWSARSWPR